MAKILYTMNYTPNSSRFQVQTTHYSTIYLLDTLTNKEYIIECVGTKEKNSMLVWNDIQWALWVNDEKNVL